MKPHRLFTAIFATTSLIQAAHGQSDRVVQVTQLKQSFSEVPDVPAAIIEDLGDIRPLEDKSLLKRLRVTASLRAEFVSNALSRGNHGSGDLLLLPTVGASYEQPFGAGFSLSLNARTESFIYAKFDEESFWGFSGAALLNYQPTPESLRIYAGAEPSWYSSIRTGSQLSEAIGISAGVQKEWAFNRDQSIFFLGYNFTHYASSPAVDDRDAHRVTAGITHQIRPSVHGQLYYSYQWSDYTNATRRDSRNLVGVNFVFRLNNHWTANATAYLVDNDSTAARANYQTFGTGLGISCQF